MRYVERTAVLETEHHTAAGRVRVRDALVPVEGSESQSAIVRVCEGLEGRIEMASIIDPRPDYSRFPAVVEPAGRGQLKLRHGEADLRVLASIEQAVAETRFTLEPGGKAAFVLAYGEPPARPAQAESLLEATAAWWRDWCRSCAYAGPYRDAVERSAITLKLLSHRPSGAIIAAPTTSLPEEIGGERNWDYRFAWLRDASLTLYALLGTGQRREAHPFLDWICARVCENPEEVARSGLRIMYAVDGGPVPEERILEHLEGYRGSRPVRIGNAAAHQLQLDIYGEVLDCFLMCSSWGREDIVRLWPHFARLADWVCDHWHEPDNGIWEVRGGLRHFVYSKVMAWVALDRALRVAESLGLEGDLGRWRRHAGALRVTVLEQGWSDRLGAFKQSFEDERLDASNLLLPLVGFLPADDPRALSNLERIRAELSNNGLLYRYLDAPDGVAGGEATFAICTFWLVIALAQAGRQEEALELFEHALSYASPLGLFSEEIEPETGELLGNFPQGFSHSGLISAAVTSRGQQASGRHPRRKRRRELQPTPWNPPGVAEVPPILSSAMANMTEKAIAETAPFRIPSSPTEATLLAKYFRGLGDPTRLNVLELLEKRERTVGEIVERLGVSQPKISNHLACLRWCGFVETRRSGRFVFYRLTDRRVRQMVKLGRELLRENEEHVALCQRIDGER